MSASEPNSNELKILPSVEPQETLAWRAKFQEISNPTPESLPVGEAIVSQPAAIAPDAPLPDAHLTEEKLVARALANNPTIAQAAAEVRALRGKWVQVGLPPNPTAGYTSSEIGDEGKAGQQGGYFGQNFITGGKLRLNRAVASQEVLRAEQRLAAQQQRVRTDVRQQFYNLLIAKRKLELAQNLVDVNNRAVQASQQLLQAQEISQAALLQTEVQQQSAAILLLRANNEWQAGWRKLSAVVGESTDLEPQPLAGDLEEILVELSWENQLARLTAESPEIAAAVAGLQAKRWALQRAYAEVKPNLNTQVSIQYDNATTDTIAGIQVGLPLPLWNRNQGGKQQARAEVKSAQENIERVELDLKRRLAEAFQSYADARYQVEGYSANILPKAKKTLDLVSNGYQQGEIGYLDLLTAQRTYTDTNSSYLEALRTLWQSTVRIEGLLLESSLQQSL